MNQIKLKTDALCEYKVTTLNGIYFLRDEQYNLLWNELETITDEYHELSEHHRMLYDFVSHAASQSPGSQSSRLNQTVKGDDIHIHTYI